MYKSSPDTPAVTKINRTKGEETRERIFQLALEYFNRNGIEYVGIRELARELGLSPGNVSYYFPTKDDLVLEIARRLSAENTKLFQEAEQDLSLTAFIELFVAAFHNHYNFRCIFTSFVHIMKHYPALGEGYLGIQRTRRAVIHSDISELAALGYLKKDLAKADLTNLVLVISHLARFWVQEAEVLMKSHTTEKIIRHYAGLIASTLLPFATSKGRAQLEPFTKAVIAKL